jgi:hypothetical protein
VGAAAASRKHRRLLGEALATQQFLGVVVELLHVGAPAALTGSCRPRVAAIW